MYPDCKRVIKRESELQLNTGALAASHTGTTEKEEFNAK